MSGLTARQTQILKALIDEYIETAIPVGSDNLEKKYELGVSPATIRNEMVTLTKTGYLRQPHTSAGRIPTPIAMKFYINQLMEEKQMSLADEVKAKEEVWDSRDDADKLMSEAVQALSRRTGSLVVGAIDDHGVWHSGYANVFLNPEFADIQTCSSLFAMLEEASRIHELFFEKFEGSTPVEVIFGEELGWTGFRPISIVATNFEVNGKKAALGVVGPTRASYPTIIPVMRYFSQLMGEIAGR
ncbi:hypothetical protein ACFL2C_01685 [Patescibacteria group bacterium]